MIGSDKWKFSFRDKNRDTSNENRLLNLDEFRAAPNHSNSRRINSRGAGDT